MRIMDAQPAVSGQGLRLVGHAGDTVAAKGAYRCLCCGVVVWHLQKGRRFPDCPSANCPTMWLWWRP